VTQVVTNSLFWMVLAGLAGFYILDSVAALLGLRSVQRHAGAADGMPESVASIYDSGEWRRLEQYTSANTKAELLESAFGFALILLFWLSGGFGILNRLIGKWGLGAVPGGVLFIALLWAGRWLLFLPFGIHHTFCIEQKFGFNKTTPRTYAVDQAKSLLIAIVLGGPVLAVVLALLDYRGPRAWLYAWIFTSLLLFVFAWLAPAILMPLFNKFMPLERGDLKDAIIRYARSNAFPIQDIFVMDGSRRSTRANAFFTGFGRTRKIVLFDTLIKNHTSDELVAVLAHEIGHYKRRHIIQKLASGVCNIGLFLFLASILIRSPALAEAFGIRSVPVYGGLAVFLLAYGPIGRLISLAAGFQSRRHEYSADRFAVETTGKRQPMIDALKKLSKNNLANLVPHALQVVLHYSHPPLARRIAAIQAIPSLK